MRRMLDPTKVGGNTAKLYKHTINCWSSTYGSVYLTIYNTSSEEINSEAKLITAITSIGKVAATGYLTSDINLIVYIVSLTNDGKAIAQGYQYGNTGNVKTRSVILDYHFSFSDNVKEVM